MVKHLHENVVKHSHGETDKHDKKNKCETTTMMDKL